MTTLQYVLYRMLTCFLDVIKWGRRDGHQRYRCKNCGSMFTFRRKDASKANRFVWFEWWILRKQVTQIAELSGCSERQLYRWFDEYLENYPTWHIQRREKVNLLIDGTWFPNKMCLGHLYIWDMDNKKSGK